MRGGWIGAALALAMAAPGAMAQPAKLATGLMERSYPFADAGGKAMPYELYIPTSYDARKAWPLVMVLHGAGGDHKTVFANSNLADLAEKRGVIVVAPLGYNAFGGYGDIYPTIVTAKTAKAGSKSILELSLTPGMTAPARNPAAAQAAEPPAGTDEAHVEVLAGDLAATEASKLSETDTMNVLALVRKDFNIDARRIYLMGNSMGGVGTAYLAVKYPDIWAAVAPAGGALAAWSYPIEKLRDHKLPALFVHGEKDEHAHYRFNKAMVEAAQKKGVDVKMLIVPGASHGRAWIVALPQTFDFLLAHRRAVR
ncbi:MAG: prolyl oligopeptidase family serine peptidase [Caulobacteraceae bacterium]